MLLRGVWWRHMPLDLFISGVQNPVFYTKYTCMKSIIIWTKTLVNLLVFLDDADKITWLSYLDMEAIPGERNWFLWQISFVQLGNGFLHPFLYHRVHLKKNWKRSFCIFLTLELRNGSISIKSHIFVYKFPRGVTYINNQRKTVSA